MRSYSLPELAEMLFVHVRTVETWIASGELRAVNVSRSRNSRRPRFRVMQADLDLFLEARATDADAKRQPQRRRPWLPKVEVFV